MKDGQPVAPDAPVGTGMVLQLVGGDNVLQEVTVVVKGDTNGDGKITITDMLSVKSHLLKKQSLSGAVGKAADYNIDDGISITDFIGIKAYILNK